MYNYEVVMRITLHQQSERRESTGGPNSFIFFGASNVYKATCHYCHNYQLLMHLILSLLLFNVQSTHRSVFTLFQSCMKISQT